MAKVSRSMLKSIVKECLVELLAEGLSGGDTSSLNESLSMTNSTSNFKQAAMPAQSSKKVVNESFEDNTNKAISQTTNDPIMAAILQDTAKTTLQEQNGADRPNQFTAKPTDTYSQIASESDPMKMFEGAANNWASLAFSDSKKQ
tara:strand:- start:2640 stop:3074 length:435 start_codon:yes stop_codon:yes gene_type:complete